jgi:hypothetical protein
VTTESVHSSSDYTSVVSDAGYSLAIVAKHSADTDTHNFVERLNAARSGVSAVLTVA